MRLQTIFMVLLLIALLFSTIGYIVRDTARYYPEAGNITTEWENKFDYSIAIAGNFTSLNNDLQNLANEESGWQRILGGLLVFSKGVLLAILTVLTSPIYVISILALIGSDFGIPPALIYIVGLMVIGSVIFMIVKFLHRSPSAV